MLRYLYSCVFLLFFSVFLTVLERVTAQEVKRSVVAEENPFRIKKLNFIWSKAVHHIADKAAIKRLKTQLDTFDGLYLSAKEHIMKNKKDDTEEIDRKLEELLKRYDLDAALSAYNKKMKWMSEEELKKENSVLSSVTFADAKLNKLWRAAVAAQFTEHQLKALLKELKDHEKRIDEYNEKVAEFNKIRHENYLDEEDLERKEQMNKELKSHYIEMEEAFEKLHGRITDSSKSPFKNGKVDELWKTALLNSNFSEVELESIRFELQHFDRQLEKLKFHEEELEATKEQKRKSGKTNVLSEAASEFEEEHGRLKRKLRKLQNFLETKISHTEL